VREDRASKSPQTTEITTDATHPDEPARSTTSAANSSSSTTRSKLSVNVSHEISEHLRNLAYSYRLSESSIVEVALTIFFARGDDALLGVLLKQLGATRRSK
jgi:hypothetical protein